MGQTISEPPPNHRPGEHYIPYDVNAWRRLSQTYLNHLFEIGKLTKEELDLIELEQYWQRRSRLRGSHSLSPIRRHSLISSSNVKSIVDDFGQDQKKRPIWKNLEQSSHLTKNNHYQYHSLANLSGIKPSKNHFKNLITNLEYDRHIKRDPEKNVPISLRKNQSPFNSSSSSYTFSDITNDSLSPRKFEQNKSVIRKDLTQKNRNVILNDNNDTKRYNQSESNERYSIKSNKLKSEPKKFQEYYPKSPNKRNDTDKIVYHRKNIEKEPLLKSENVANGNRKKETYLNESVEKSYKINDSVSFSSNSFSKTDSTRTKKSERSFIAEIGEPERLVEHSYPSFDSNFHRQQRQSSVPEFRINSQERLNNNYNNHHINRVHFNEQDSFIPTKDYVDHQVDDEFLSRRHGSRYLMRTKQKSYSKLLPNGSFNNISTENIKYIPYRGYYLNPEQTKYSRYYQNFDRPRIGYTKIVYIILLIANVGCIFWNSVYMHFASVKIKMNEPIDGRLISMSLNAWNLWQWIVITVQTLNCLLSIWAIYASLREKYWSIFTITFLFYLIASFGAFSEFLRGSIFAWLLPLICGHSGIVLTHQIAINHYSI